MLKKFSLDYAILGFALAVSISHRIAGFFYRAEDIAWLGLIATTVFYVVLATEIAVILDRTNRNRVKLSELEDEIASLRENK